MYFKWDGLSTEWLKFQHSHPMGFVSLKNLKLKLIRLIYGEHYNIHVLRVSLDHVGHTGARRDRLYLVLNHKMRTQQLCNPNDLYMHIIDQVSKAVHTTVQDYFVSSLREIDIAAAELAATRRKFVPWIHGTWEFPSLSVFLKNIAIVLNWHEFYVCVNSMCHWFFNVMSLSQALLDLKERPLPTMRSGSSGNKEQGKRFEVSSHWKRKESHQNLEQGLPQEVFERPQGRQRTCLLLGGQCYKEMLERGVKEVAHT